MSQTIISRSEVNRINTLRGQDIRKRVRELRLTDMFITMAEIARIFGISRQRVFQILLEEGLPTKHLVRPVKKYQYNCLVCGKISANKFCSDECQKQWQ